MDFWICFPSQQFWVGVEMGRGSKNITLCILCPSTQRWGRTGGTLGVFPIWENYAILQTQKYHPSHRKSHGGAGGKIEFFSNEDICKFVFKILADGWICFKCFCWISPPAPDYISWLMVVKGDEQRRNLCMAAFVDFCFQFKLYLYFYFIDLPVCISIFSKLSICVHTCICEFVFPAAPTSPRLRFPP